MSEEIKITLNKMNQFVVRNAIWFMAIQFILIIGGICFGAYQRYGITDKQEVIQGKTICNLNPEDWEIANTYEVFKKAKK